MTTLLINIRDHTVVTSAWTARSESENVWLHYAWREGTFNNVTHSLNYDVMLRLSMPQLVEMLATQPALLDLREWCAYTPKGEQK